MLPANGVNDVREARVGLALLGRERDCAVSALGTNTHHSKPNFRESKHTSQAQTHITFENKLKVGKQSKTRGATILQAGPNVTNFDIEERGRGT